MGMLTDGEKGEMVGRNTVGWFENHVVMFIMECDASSSLISG